jgi:hypothetical protein
MLNDVGYAIYHFSSAYGPRTKLKNVKWKNFL